MAEEAKPLETPPVEDPHDLGDTSLYPSPEPPVPETPVPDERPRNADGTYAPTKPKHEHPAYLVQRAKELGYDDDDLEDISTTRLNKIVHLADKERLTLLQARQLRESAVVPLTTPEPEESLGLDEEQYDHALLGVLKGLQKSNKQLSAQVQRMQQAEQKRDVETKTEWIDRLMTEHGDEAKLGKEPLSKLKTDSNEHARKLAVWQEACRQAGQNATDEDRIKLIPKAIKTLGWEKASEAPPVSSSSKSRVSEEEWKKAGLARPTQRSGAPEPKGDAVAKDNLRRNMEHAGQLDDSEIMDGIPE